MEKSYGTTSTSPSPFTPRKASASSSTTSSTASTRPTSTFSSPTSTRSDGCPFSPGVVFDRSPSTSSPGPDCLYVVVKLADPFKTEAITESDELPSRPPKRPLLTRLSTRLFRPKDAPTYKAIRMPRSAYNAYFRRDSKRNYIGKEPERSWTEAELMAEFAEYQDQPLGKVGVCAI